MPRTFKVEGTKSFYYAALLLLALGLWAVKDGWLPSEKMLKHQDFNKSLAIISLIGSAVCGYIHKVVK